MRDIRLDALREAPYAFASTYAREAAFPEQTWRERATSGSSILAYLPEFGRAPVGLVASIQEIPGQLELVSMWVRPQARGRQVGSALVEAIVERARRAGVPRVHLWVTESNKPGRPRPNRCRSIRGANQTQRRREHRLCQWPLRPSPLDRFPPDSRAQIRRSLSAFEQRPAQHLQPRRQTRRPSSKRPRIRAQFLRRCRHQRAKRPHRP